MRVRFAQRSDWDDPRIRGLLEAGLATFDAEPDMDKVRQLAFRMAFGVGNLALIAERDGVPVGYLGAMLAPMPFHKGDVLVVMGLYGEKGAGRALLLKARTEARRQGASLQVLTNQGKLSQGERIWQQPSHLQ